MRAQLDEVRVPVLQHSPDRRFEQHRGAGVLPPVGGARLVSLQPLTGNRRIQRKRGRLRRQSLEGVEEVVLDRLHVVRVVRHLHGERPVEDPGLVQLPRDVVEEVAVAGDGHRRRAVDRGHRHPPPELVERLAADRPHQRFGVEADGEHAALSAGALLEAASVIDHLDRLLEGEQSGEMMSGHFTCAVADYGVGCIPNCASCSASATWMAKLAGCAISVSAMRERVSSRRSSSIKDQSA